MPHLDQWRPLLAMETHGPAQPQVGPGTRGRVVSHSAVAGPGWRAVPGEVLPPRAGPSWAVPQRVRSRSRPRPPTMAARRGRSYHPAAWGRCPKQARPAPLCPACAPPEAEAAAPRGSGRGAGCYCGLFLFPLPLQPPSLLRVPSSRSPPILGPIPASFPDPTAFPFPFSAPFLVPFPASFPSHFWPCSHSWPRSHSRSCHGGPRQLREQQRAGLFRQAHQRLLPRGHWRLRELLQVRRPPPGPVRPCPRPSGALTRRFLLAACSRGSSSGPSRWFTPRSPAAASSAGCVWVREVEGAPGGLGGRGKVADSVAAAEGCFNASSV